VLLAGLLFLWFYSMGQIAAQANMPLAGSNERAGILCVGLVVIAVVAAVLCDAATRSPGKEERAAEPGEETKRRRE
jgi:hypothetical protein